MITFFRAFAIAKALFILLTVINISEAQTLTGIVIDSSNGEPVSSAVVRVNTLEGKKIETVSGISGAYTLNISEPGSYLVSVERLGYDNFSAEVNISGLKTLNLFILPSKIETQRINVTSTKTEVTLQQTPSSISIVNSEEIDNKNPFTFDQVLQDIHGINITRSSGVNVSSLSIRGSSDVAGGGIGNRVLLLVDGRPSLTGDSKGALWSLIPISIIERTEVVKGAFSSLYGSSAIGGVVNVITKKPAYKFFGSLNLNYGFYEKLSDSLSFTNKLQTFKGVDGLFSNTTGKLAYLLNAAYKQNEGHSQQTAFKLYGVISKFTYDLFSNRDIELSFSFSGSESDFPHYWRKEAGSISEPYKTAKYYLGDRIYKKNFSGDVYYRAVPNSISKYTTRFYYYRLDSKSIYNSNNPVSLQFAPAGSALTTYSSSFNFGNISQVDLQLSSRNYLISGLDLQWNIVESSPEEILYGNQQMNNFGVYIQDSHKLIVNRFNSPLLTLTAGVRYDINKVVGGIRSSQLSPKISFLYSPAVESGLLKETSFRMLAGKSFRAPSIAELYFKKELFGGFEFVYNPSLKSENMYSIEAGINKQYKDRFVFDISAFFNYYKDLIQYRNIGSSINGPFQVQNIADAQIRGIEAGIDYNSEFKLIKKIKYYFNLNYTFVDARDISSERKNDKLPYKPAHTFNFTANLNSGIINLNFSGKYLSKIDEVLFYAFEEPKAYFLLNSKVSVDVSDKIQLYFAAGNLLNASYQELERIQSPNRNFNAGIKLNY